MRPLNTLPAPPPAEQSLAPLLQHLRSARFSHGLACPHCHARRIQRWGHFASRQRYRCRACRRTFSDLTGTAAAYIKKLGALSRYAAQLREGLSVRRSAVRVGVQASTAFRWRHRLLGALAREEAEPLRGWVEVGVVGLRESAKGCRRLGREARRRGPRPGWRRGLGTVSVLVASDRCGHVVTGVLGVRQGVQLWTRDLEAELEGRLVEVERLLAAEGPMGAVATYARRHGLQYHDLRRGYAALPRSLAHGATVAGYARRLVRWMVRFRGVATHYLANYLAWHEAVDREQRQGVGGRALRWPLGFAFG